MKKNKDNYIYIPTDMRVKNKRLKVVYRKKYLGKVPKSLIYKLKKRLYLYIMEYMKTQPINKTAILNRAEAVIVDKKYARIYTLVANKYDRFEEKYERLANDFGYNALTKLIGTGKLSLGLALSLFLILNDPTLTRDYESEEPPMNSTYYAYLNTDNIIELTEKPDDFISNTPLSDLTRNNTYTTEAMVYTQEAMPNHFLSPEKQKTFEYFVKEYALYFNLNSEYLIDVFKQATNDYSNIDVLIDSSRYDITNPETVAIMYVYFFYRNPSKYLNIDVTDYGYTSKSDFVTSDEIFIIEPNWMHNHVEDKSVQKEDITLRNGLRYSEYMGRISELVGIPFEYQSYALSVSYAERGQYGSINSIYKNNMGGQKDDEGNIIVYPSPEAGIIAFIVNLRRYEFDYNITSMDKFGRTYDGDAFVNQWIRNVNDFHEKISTNMPSYFLTDDELDIYLAKIEDLIFNDDVEYEVVPLNTNPIKVLIYEEEEN